MSLNRIKVQYTEVMNREHKICLDSCVIIISLHLLSTQVCTKRLMTVLINLTQLFICLKENLKKDNKIHECL